MAGSIAIRSTFASAFAKTARQMNVTSTAESLTRHKLEIPGGFAYGAFNGAAQIKPWSILRMVETARAVLFTESKEGISFLDANLVYKNYFMFILASTMQVDKKFYSTDLVKAPIHMDVELDHVGQTSFQMKTSAFLPGIPEPLFVSRVATVFVCNQSRQPKAPPDWWLEKFAKAIPQIPNPMTRLDMSGKNEGESTERNHTIGVSDVDAYRHTNWSNYVKYSYDAFVEHSIAKADTGSHVEIFRELSDFSIVYRKESSIGDAMTTTVFPHRNDPNTFFFNISKGQSLCCECKMKFHSM